MKKGGILHPALNKLIAETGHTDYIVVSDAGLPIPKQVNTCIDLNLKEGLVGFLDALDTVLSELTVERVILAEELKTISSDMHTEIAKRFHNVPIEFMPHTAFKEETKQARGVVRTGEFTPYANIILVAGVAY